VLRPTKISLLFIRRFEPASVSIQHGPYGLRTGGDDTLNTADHSATSTQQVYDAVPCPEPLALSVAGAAQLSGIGRSSMYIAIQRGELPVRKWGKRTVVLMTDLKSWLASLPVANRRAA
jgi:hypothetical protein